MLTKLKAPLTAIMLSSVAVVPAATVAFMGSTDMAIAKSDKAGGGGQGSQKASKSQSGSKGKSGTKGSSSTKGKSGTKSSSASGAVSSLGNKVDKFLGKVTGKDKARKSAARTQSAKIAKDDLMHPSNLGKMNGPLHANINAVLAHIKNGNTNGPIGGFAAMAVAGVNAEGAQEVLDLKQDFADLQAAIDASPYDTLEDYLAARQGVEPIEPIQAIEDALTDLGDAEADLASALEDAGYIGENALQDYEDAIAGGDPTLMAVEDAKSILATEQGDLSMALSDAMYDGTDPLADYEADKAGVPPALPDDGIEGPLALLGGDSANGVGPTATEPTDDEVAGAEADLQAQTDAELAMLAQWNKNPDTDPETISEEEQALLDALYARLEPYQDEIAAAIPEEEAAPEEGAAAEELGEGEPVECAEGDAGCAADEDIAAAE